MSKKDHLPARAPLNKQSAVPVEKGLSASNLVDALGPKPRPEGTTTPAPSPSPSPSNTTPRGSTEAGSSTAESGRKD